jgi:predicted O-methyltransferase YrrM
MLPLTFDDALRRLDSAPLDPGPALVDTIRELGANDPVYFRNRFEGGLGLQQIPEELDRLAHYLLTRFGDRPVRYLEIGVGGCATLIFLSRLWARHAVAASLTAVDNLDYQRRGLVTAQRTRIDWCIEHLGLEFANLDTRTPDFRGWLSGRQFDVILVDGDHSFSGCLWDTVISAGALAPGGVLVLHDITSKACPGVGDVFAISQLVATAAHSFSAADTCGIGVLEGLANNPELLPAALAAALYRVDGLEHHTAELTALTGSVRAVITQALPRALEARRARRASI